MKNTLVTESEIEKQKSIMRHIRDTARDSALRLAYVDTYGCQQNESDSEKLRGMLREMGYEITPDEFAAEIVVINTCAIRENAENRVLGNIGALVHTKKAKPSQIIVMCGCLAGVPETVAKIRESYAHVSLTFPPNALWRFPELLYAVMLRRALDEGRDPAICRAAAEMPVGPRRMFVDDDRAAIAEGLPTHRDMQVRAWLPVMYGCDNFCSYCIVPYVRGRERSREREDILEEARGLVAAGYKDITLLGQNVNSYGAGGSDNFPSLLRAITAIEGEFLIRFMTSHPKDASAELFEAMAQSGRAARHIHLPFQSGSDRILALMNRGYTQSEYLEKVAAARKLMPDISLTSDVIIGFPGETDDDYEQTLRLIEAARFDSLFIFIYSKRPGTPAAKLEDNLPKEVKAARFERLNNLQNSISVEKHSRFIGKTVRVLVDGQTNEGSYTLKSRTNGGRLVHLTGGPELIGRFVDAGITHCNSWSLFGEP
ncbi:MAG: tRNA (N6-isopentenyl adenosine(37)-C2)-methylthiotransferase MiaB [Oscillospiraceae bacterium]|nr:tRNA (N6-isopentenyl adenosine(37)-C2)-methylthiotransferase MiaB [Oscillospiraceae bacterium]